MQRLIQQALQSSVLKAIVELLTQHKASLTIMKAIFMIHRLISCSKIVFNLRIMLSVPCQNVVSL